MGLLERHARLLERIVEELRAHHGARRVAVAVFGSVGRGTPREDSDVDLLIVVRDLPGGRTRRVADDLPVEARLERDLATAHPGGLPIQISPVFETPEEVAAGSPLLLDMVEDARILHDPEGCLADRLHRLRTRLAGLGARRGWRGNAGYWDLEPDCRPGAVNRL